MTAIDVASQTKRLGAEDVTFVYRRGPERMGASRYEQELAQTDGVLIRHSLRPRRLIGETGRLVGVEFEYTREDEAGRLAGTGETLTLPCDQLFKAIGQVLVPADLEGTGGELLELSGGRVAVDAERRTSLERVWAGGDCVLGGRDLTVVAVEDGKQAALSIDRHLAAAAPPARAA
jgi:glutamate synthase (NADPH/NADH) small chain